MRSRLVLAHSEVGSMEFNGGNRGTNETNARLAGAADPPPGELLGTLVAAFGHAQEMADRVSKSTDKVSDAARLYY
jgi:hypothetical protein